MTSSRPWGKWQYAWGWALVILSPLCPEDQGCTHLWLWPQVLWWKPPKLIPVWQPTAGCRQAARSQQMPEANHFHRACFTESCLSIPSQWLFVLGSNCVTENLEVENIYCISKVLRTKFLRWKKEKVLVLYIAYFTIRSLKEAGNDLMSVYRIERYFVRTTDLIVSLRFSYLCFDCSSSGFCMHFWRGLFWSGPSAAELLWFVGCVTIVAMLCCFFFFFLFHFYALKVTSFSLSFLKIKTFPADTSNPFFDPFTTVPQFSVSRMCNWKAVYLTQFQGII